VLGSCWLAVGALVLVVGLVAVPALMLHSAGRAAPLVSPLTLPAPACFVDPAPQPATPTHVQGPNPVLPTPCNVPHNGQIFATFTVTGSRLDYPGSAKLLSIAASGCTTRAQTSLEKTKAAGAAQVRYLYPSASSWRAGHQKVTCMIVTPAPTLTSSLVKGYE